MRDGESRFTESTQRAGIRRPMLDGRNAHLTLGPGSDGRRASRRGLSARFLLLGLLVAASVVLVPATASAEYRYPSPTYSFGPDGTSASMFPEPAALNSVTGVTYQQASDLLYAVTPPAPTKIYGFHFTGPGSLSPLTSPFPLEPEQSRLFSGIGVDNTNLLSAGNIHYTSMCGCPTSYSYAYSPAGSFLFKVGVSKVPAEGAPGLEAATAEGVAVDNEGHIWVVDGDPNKIEEFEPTGGAAIRVLETYPTAGTFPHSIAFDRSTDDLYVGFGGDVARLTAASDYSMDSVKHYGSGGEAIAVNAAAHLLFVAGFGVRVYNTETGFQVDEFGVGTTFAGVAVDEATGTVFLTPRATGQIQERKPEIVPDVHTGEPSGNAMVTGSVGLAGGGEVTECYFDVGEGTGYGLVQQACEPGVPYLSDKPLVTGNLAGLVDEEKTYHYRLVARNANGILSLGEDRTITPTHVVFLKTEPATSIQRATVTLNGSYEGSNEDTDYYFEYGLTDKYGTSTPLENKGLTVGPTALSKGITGLTAGTTYHYRVAAENGKGLSHGADRTFKTAPAVKDIDTAEATEIDKTTATLNGSLDPDGYETKFYFEYGRTTAYGHTVPASAPPGVPVGTVAPGITPVEEEIEDLEVGATYHFRLVASNETGVTFGLDEVMTMRQPPSLASVSSADVSATSAKLTATINPNGFDTTYYFEYGTTTEYGTEAPVGGGELVAANTAEPVVVEITGLKETTYHFRLTAENQWGKSVSENQTFDFKPPSSCPNHAVRQQTGAGYLPDCRAYELVSAERGGGAFLFAQAPNSPLASSPGRFAFAAILNGIPDTGEPVNGTLEGDLYVSSRTGAGWKTRYVGMPGSHSIGMNGPRNGEFYGPASIPADQHMDKFMVFDKAQRGSVNGGTLEGSFAPYIYDNSGNLLGRLPTNLDEIPGAEKDVTEGGFEGDSRASPDFSHYVFSSRELAFAEDGLSAAPGSAYDNDIAADTVEVVSITAQGGDIPGVGNDYIRIPAVSTDGSHILMSTGAGNSKHLYMRVNDLVSYDISLGEDGENHGVRYVGMTSDGRIVYFTSAEQLTADDTDASIDLYRWSETTQQVARVSTGTEGGNRGSCAADWITGCDVEIIPTPHDGFNGAEPPIDSVFASQSGEIYFYSPEELDGTQGALGKRNLYVYRNGAPRQVAIIESKKPLTRIQVAPDGAYMGMITGTRLTAYNNNGAAEMYRYDVAARSLLCVSCRPDGGKPEGDVSGSQNGLFMTFDGRMFFSTVDALIPRDANGIPDVYEYSAGRAQLISSGTGDAAQSENQPIGLVSVSGDGTDVFFATVDTLVQQDENGPFLKYYDARTNGGFPFEKPPTPCAAADECHGPESGAPAPLALGTTAKLGLNGNESQPKKKAGKRKGKGCSKRRKNRCQKKKPKARHQQGQGEKRHG